MRNITFVLIGVLLLTVAPSADDQKVKVFVTTHMAEPGRSEFVDVHPRQVSSAKDLRNALRKKVQLVRTREEAQIVLVVLYGTSYAPDREVISITGSEDLPLHIERRQAPSIPIRGVRVTLLVPGTNYQTSIYGSGIWLWRNAAKRVSEKVMAWIEVNSGNLGELGGK